MLKKFWLWLGKTPEQYAEGGIEYVYNHMEFDYPRFCELEEYAKSIVDCDAKTEEEIDDLLVIMALDNESEHILEYIEENSSEEQFRIIVEAGTKHMQYHARWQLCELLYRRKPAGFMDKLMKLACDKHWYVRKRAENVINCLMGETHSS